MLVEVVLVEESGVILLKHTISRSLKEKDTKVVGGFVSAIGSFAQTISGGEMQDIHLSTIRFLLYKSPSSKITCVFVLKDDTRQIRHFLTVQEKIIASFESRYDLHDWKSSLPKFEPFKPVIADVLRGEICHSKIAALAERWRTSIDANNCLKNACS